MNNINNLIRTLKRKKIKISCAESCTGGLLASSITSVSGASKVFNLGLVTYSNHCLLYTSPSPRDLSTSRMPSSA